MDLREVFEFYKGKKVLVTGHTGFKGAWLSRILINAGAEVTGYSLEPPTAPELFSMAGEVWEVVCGIPVQLKGKKEQTGEAGTELADGQNKEGKESLHMKFITGGAFQGKRSFAEQLLEREGIFEYATADGAADPFEAAYSRKLVVNVQDYVRRFADLEDGEARERLQEFLDRLIKENPGAVAVMDEIGCGIVPVGREERLWRDLAGEAAQTLAARSRDVYRVTGGLAQVLKGGAR